MMAAAERVSGCFVAPFCNAGTAAWRACSWCCAQQGLGFLRQHVDEREGRLAGNSVHVDLGFLKAHMPDLASHLHYRIVDVSSVAELCARWFPAEYKRAPRKKVPHVACSGTPNRRVMAVARAGSQPHDKRTPRKKARAMCTH